MTSTSFTEKDLYTEVHHSYKAALSLRQDNLESTKNKRYNKFHSIWLGNNLRLKQYNFDDLIMSVSFLMYDTVCAVRDTHTKISVHFCVFLTLIIYFLCLWSSQCRWTQLPLRMHHCACKNKTQTAWFAHNFFYSVCRRKPKIHLYTRNSLLKSLKR